ncbi:MAG TPA: glycine reductase [Clostridiales bacterium]|nr:glycine reductase [Clostridiales bacterium]
MNHSVLKGTGYVLVHVPGMVMHHGTTQTTERSAHPDSDYLKELPKHIRSYEDCLAYPPNQTYIGNLSIEELSDIEEPWFDKKTEHPSRFGPFGEVMPEDEFAVLMQICDAFDLVHLDKEFVQTAKPKLEAHPLITAAMLSLIKEGQEPEVIRRQVEEEHAQPVIVGDKLVGYVKRAHDVDVNLSAHVIFENLVSKASEVLTILHLLKQSGVDPNDVDYVIDCSEEACGDMNQRGGGNFAKAAAEIAGLLNATGSDTRAFCAGPAHAIVEAASLVKAGAFKNVIVAGGGCTAKLGMNGKDHVRKGLPILEDCLGGFAALISENDGVNPEINLEIIGRHTVGTGSSPQAVIESLVTNPLTAAGMKITDVDKYSPEMQNPDITKPAGAGDVPEANYKMIAALGVKLGQLERAELPAFVKNHGLRGFAPTQGHIPSGVPYLGFARESMLAGRTKNAMIIGKGSLFLGRMTNQFDGISFFLQKNTKKEASSGVSASAVITAMPVIGVAIPDSELGEEMVRSAVASAGKNGYKAVLIEGDACLKRMDEMLIAGEIDAAVAAHNPFPVGVATVGRIATPALGREMFLATTTGTSATDRVEAMVRNAIAGIIAAKTCGIEDPTVGIANVEGGRQCERILQTLSENGYSLRFADSARADGGILMRGNDLLQGSADVMVMDTLTGNLMMKVLSAFTTGGGIESVGYGYGPGIGEDYEKRILIVSRASGAAVIANAIEYAAQTVRGDLLTIARCEYAKAKKAGLQKLIDESKQRSPGGPPVAAKAIAPPKETCTEEIHGIEVMELDEAVEALWSEGIYAESGMGCTGPVLMINDARIEQAKAILQKKGYVH